MKKFSELDNITSLNEDFQAQTGLPLEVVQSLSNSFVVKFDGESERVSEGFQQLLESSRASIESYVDKNLKLDSIIEEVEGLIEYAGYAPDWNKPEKDKLLAKILQYVKSLTKNSRLFIQVMAWLMYKFFAVTYSALELDELFESENIPLLESEQLKIFGEKFDLELSNENKLYVFRELEALLSDANNKIWGDNYHIDNMFKMVWGKLQYEISDLTTTEEVEQVSSNHRIEIINSLITNGSVDLSLTHYDNLKAYVPDIQSLVYDMVLVVGRFLASQPEALSFVNRDKVNSIKSLTKSILIEYVESLPKSVVLNVDHEGKNYFLGDLERKDIFDAIYDFSEYRTIHNMGIRGIYQAVEIIKSCSVDFNLVGRRQLNSFVTLSMTVLKSLEVVLNRFATQAHRVTPLT